MARTAITPEVVEASGLEATYTAAIADGHMFDNDGTVFLHVKNGDSSDVDVTITTTIKYDGDLDVDDRVVTVTAGEDRFIGPFARHVYNQGSGDDAGKVYVDYESTTSVTIAVMKLDS